MKKNFHFLLLAFTLLAGTNNSVQGQDKDGFVLLKKENRICIYERWVTFPKSKPAIKAREVKGEFVVNSSIYQALALVKNETKIKIWQTHVSEFKVFLQTDTTWWYEYSYHDIPWPVSDQDHFLIYKLTVLPDKNLFVSFESKTNNLLAPVRDDADRMALSGSWLFEKLADHKTKVTYRIISMPSSIPKFITDPVIRRNMMNTIESYVAILEQKKKQM
jgi:hypothetical protein